MRVKLGREMSNRFPFSASLLIVVSNCWFFISLIFSLLSMVQSSASAQAGGISRASDIEAEVYEAVRSSGLLADLEDGDDLHEPDEEDEEDDDDDEENDEENEDDYEDVSMLSQPLHLANIDKIIETRCRNDAWTSSKTFPQHSTWHVP